VRTFEPLINEKIDSDHGTHLEEAKSMKPVTIGTLFSWQRPIHSNDTVANRTLVKMCKIPLDIVDKEIQSIHNRPVLS
jgi:hypothetical protein